MDDLYDEFGNYIGADVESDDASDKGIDAANYLYDDEPSEVPDPTGLELMEIDDGPSNAIVLHEDKQYYPTAKQVYGEDVEILVQEEDAQPLSVPLVAPVVQKRFNIQEKNLPPTYFSRKFMVDIMKYPDQIRNVALAGHFHHGKSAFMDMLVLQTHNISDRLEKRVGRKRDEQLRYTDTHIIERERGLSVKCAPMSLILQSTKGKSHLINIIDTPGHVNFADEVAVALRLADGLCLVVDALEGVEVNTEQIIKHAALQGLPMTLVINKMDRLILELKLPPTDAYFKLRHIIDQVNTIMEHASPVTAISRRISPEKGNVLFACTDMGWCFTLQSFAKKYVDRYGGINTDEFARRLWGDICFNPEKGTFVRKSTGSATARSFVTFVLEPIYKLYSHTISESPERLEGTLKSLGIQLKPSQYRADAKLLLRLVCEEFFGPATAFVDMVVNHIPSPLDGAERMLERYYTGPLDTRIAGHLRKCSQDGPLVVYVTKLFSTKDAKGFCSFGRVMSGTARPGSQVRVLGEGYSLDDPEEMVIATISEVFIAESRYKVKTTGVPAGNWVLMTGVDKSIVKSATIVPTRLEDDEDAYIFQPVAHFSESVLKVAVEPINPSELPKMLDGLRKIEKSYPLIKQEVEESGEHIVLGTGELYMDCVMHDLRKLYADMEIKVSDPVTRFCETAVETSATQCYAISPNKKNKITMVAEQLDKRISLAIETGAVKIRDPVRTTAAFFENTYGWDKLAARSIWAFGPEDMGPNILLDDTLPTEVDKTLLKAVKDSITHGFRWAMKAGPLCDEPIRNTKFKITDVTLASEAIYRGGGQIIPTTRRACYSSFLMASPRLMEPMYAISVTAPEDSTREVYSMLARRRGHVLAHDPVPGTPLYRVSGRIPVIDSFGFETDVRINTKGAAMVSLLFDGWNEVPGDPLDPEAVVPPLQAAFAQATARDFMLKTRRRKGMSEDVSVATFLEPELYQSWVKRGAVEE